MKKLYLFLPVLLLGASLGAASRREEMPVTGKIIQYAKTAWVLSGLSAIASIIGSKSDFNPIRHPVLKGNIRFMGKLSSLGSCMFLTKAAYDFARIPTLKSDLGIFWPKSK